MEGMDTDTSKQSQRETCTAKAVNHLMYAEGLLSGKLSEVTQADSKGINDSVTILYGLDLGKYTL